MIRYIRYDCLIDSYWLNIDAKLSLIGALVEFDLVVAWNWIWFGHLLKSRGIEQKVLLTTTRESYYIVIGER